MTGRGQGRQRRRARSGWRARIVALAIVAAAIIGYIALQPSGAPGTIATLDTADFHSLVFDPDNPDLVFFGHHNGIMRSADGGRTWTTLLARPNFDAMSLAAPTSPPRRLYLAGHLILQTSGDGGATWQPLAHDLPHADIHAMTASREDPEVLYAFVVGFGLFTSGDGGNSWSLRARTIPGDVMGLAAGGGLPEVLYAASMRTGVLVSRDAGATWEASGLAGSVHTVATDSRDGSVVYAGRRDGLYKSTDGGRQWTRLDFPGRDVVAIAVSPANPQVVLVLAVGGDRGHVFRSEDGGMSWGTGRR